jgi:citrate synthase
MAAVAHVLGLPEDACTALFLIARVVGWNAHALEQYGMPILIRPRAHYVPD